jgi:superfamily II DNA or RNA helicase
MVLTMRDLTHSPWHCHVSWRGVLAQYAGRLHRLQEGEREVIVYDYAGLSVPMLTKMYARRRLGYRRIGYAIEE